MNDIIETATKFPDVIKEIYGDLAKPGVSQVGKAIGGLLGLGNTILYPVHLANEKVRLRLEHNMEGYKEKLKDIPKEKIIEVPPEIGVPILEKFSYVSNEEIRDMYINLLANSSVFDTANTAHPSFVKIIESLSPDEAIFLKYFRNVAALPFIEIRLKYKTKNEWVTLADYVINDELKEGLTFKNNIASYLSNFNSLGIIDIRRDILLSPVEIYDSIWNQNKDKFNKIMDEGKLKTIEEVFPDRVLTYEKARADITPFGRLFMSACLS